MNTDQIHLLAKRQKLRKKIKEDATLDEKWGLPIRQRSEDKKDQFKAMHDVLVQHGYKTKNYKEYNHPGNHMRTFLSQGSIDNGKITLGKPQAAHSHSKPRFHTAADLDAHIKKIHAMHDKLRNEEHLEVFWDADDFAYLKEELEQIDEGKYNKRNKERFFKANAEKRTLDKLLAGKSDVRLPYSYHDQASREKNDAIKRAKMHLGRLKPGHKLTKEELEQIDEISKKSLEKYIHRAVTSHGMAGTMKRNGSPEEQQYATGVVKKRQKGISRAMNKIDHKTANFKEDTQMNLRQFMEASRALPPGMKNKGWNKSGSNGTPSPGSNRAKRLAAERAAQQDDEYDDRESRMTRALEKKPIKENEQLDELSRKTLKSYQRKAGTSAQRAWDKGDKEEDKSMSTDGTKYPEKQKRHQDAAQVQHKIWRKRDKGLGMVKKKLGEDVDLLDEAAKNPTHAKAREILKSVGDSVGKSKDGDYVVRRSYFYRHGQDSQQHADRVSQALTKGGIKHSVVRHEDHYANFRGGASVAQGSHFAAHVKIHEEVEQIDELSKMKLQKYQRLAKNSSKDRSKGISLAADKLKEENTSVISERTKDIYAAMKARQASKAAQKAKTPEAKAAAEKQSDSYKKQINREEVEQIDELHGKGSLDKIATYHSKAMRKHSDVADTFDRHGDEDSSMEHGLHAASHETSIKRANTLKKVRDAASDVRMARGRLASHKDAAKQAKRERM